MRRDLGLLSPPHPSRCMRAATKRMPTAGSRPWAFCASAAAIPYGSDIDLSRARLSCSIGEAPVSRLPTVNHPPISAQVLGGVTKQAD